MSKESAWGSRVEAAHEGQLQDGGKVREGGVLRRCVQQQHRHKIRHTLHVAQALVVAADDAVQERARLEHGTQLSCNQAPSAL
jgi:hypothetical protein